MKLPTRLLAGIAVAASFCASALAVDGARVVSAINTDMYTYIELTVNDRNMWIAAPAVAVKPGNVVRFDEGLMMTNFHSKQLQRTFPSVMFVQQVTVTGEK